MTIGLISGSVGLTCSAGIENPGEGSTALLG